MKIEDVVSKYVEIRDKRDEVKKRHEAELEPFNKGLEDLGAWLLGKLAEHGVDSFKTSHGTAYKRNVVSVTMADADMFKSYIFTPAAVKVAEILKIAGYPLGEHDIQSIVSIIKTTSKWSLVDFCAGKKGIQEIVADGEQVPPGLNMTQVYEIGVRRS